MQQIDRRGFVGTLVAGAGAALAPRADAALDALPRSPVDRVDLGRTGLRPTFLGMGTGVRGWMGQCNATRMGQEKFTAILRHALDRGIRLFDVADLYGVHPFLRAAIVGTPREELVIQTKLWHRPEGMPQPTTDAVAAVERFLVELKLDYVDSVLIHNTSARSWTTDLRPLLDGLERCRERGLIRAHGVSCHSFPALEAAAASPWVQVLLGRVNHRGTMMDGRPDAIAAHFAKMRGAGQGVIGMKIYGEGRLKTPEEREASLRYVLEQRCVDCFVIGFEAIEHIDQTFAMLTPLLAGA